jgi:hypothetical protein
MTCEIQNSQLACLILRHYLPAQLAAAAFCDFAVGGRF